MLTWLRVSIRVRDRIRFKVRVRGSIRVRVIARGRLRVSTEQVEADQVDLYNLFQLWGWRGGPGWGGGGEPWTRTNLIHMT